MPAFSVLHATRRRKNSRARMTRYAHHSTSCFVFRNARTRVRHRLEDGVMKRLLLATATTVALIAANAAQAADLGLPAKGPMAAPLPAWNWSGFYAGLNAGYARSTTVWNDLDGTINGVSGVLYRLSYSIGGDRFAPDRIEVGRFLQYGMPEFGVLDGVEWDRRLAGGDSFGASVGF